MKLWMLIVGSVGAAAIAACGSSRICAGGDSFDCESPDGGTTDNPDGSLTFPDASSSTLTATCAQSTITVGLGQSTPSVTCTASSPAGWVVDRGEIASMSSSGPSTTATFVPTGTTGGIANVIASSGKTSVSVPIFVKLTGQQSGGCPSTQLATSPSQLPQGGGIGGVGGEGCGGAVTDVATGNALANPPTSDGTAQNLKLLYPYDRTVYPRGMLAPLLQWSWSIADADAIRIDLATVSGSFSWTGTFGRPSVLSQTGTAFIRHPIPQDIWTIATNTAGTKINNQRDDLTVKLTIAKNGQAYGPITETWPIAPARLTGTVYYNSYGTRLVANWGGTTDTAGNPLGAAVLSIRSGDTGPKVAAGSNSSDDMGCRACHMVSSKGTALVSQLEAASPNGPHDYADTESQYYDLTQAIPVQTALPDPGAFFWAALSSDASYAFTNTGAGGSPPTATTNTASTFWKFGTTPQQVAFTGLPANLSAVYPSFSPDDKYLAYTDETGKGAPIANIDGPLAIAQVDLANHAMSNFQTLVTPASGKRVGFPGFLPDDSGIVFETQVRDPMSYCEGASAGGLETRCGTRAELWWTTIQNPTPVALANLNGKGYLPIGPNNHGIGGASDPNDNLDENGWDDTTLNYEPTVLPVASGGFAWVVFTSRRMYGNQLTAVPFNSWPSSYDTNDLTQGTVKKLWVAAIDLDAPAGTDPSHPAFYVPGQEIVACNSRGFWVLDPCAQNGTDCTSGDQCCNGYCEPTGQNGALVCGSTTPTCGNEGDVCSTSSVCCNGLRCVAGHCDEIPVN